MALILKLCRGRITHARHCTCMDVDTERSTWTMHAISGIILLCIYVQWNPHVGNQADTSLLQPTYTCTLRWHLFVGIIFPQFWLERYYVSAKFRDLQAKYVCMRMSSVPLAHIIHMKPSSKQTSCMLWQTDWLPLSRPSSWKACNNILASKQSAAKLKRSPD